MVPLSANMTEDESFHALRALQLEAYSKLVSVCRAQGPLDEEKQNFLKEACKIMKISLERHKAEVRRAVNDETLTAIARHCGTGRGVGVTDIGLEDWALEGRRTAPILIRTAPQTPYTAIADGIAEIAARQNKNLLSSVHTERKRCATATTSTATAFNSDNSATFRTSESQAQMKYDGAASSRKRRLSDSTLAQHLLQPPLKPSKIRQIYRLKSAKEPVPAKESAAVKEQAVAKDQVLSKEQIVAKDQHLPSKEQISATHSDSPHVPYHNHLQYQQKNPKLGNLQNIKLQSGTTHSTEEHHVQQQSLKLPQIVSASGQKKFVVLPKRGSALPQTPVATSTASILQRTLTLQSSKLMDKFKIVSKGLTTTSCTSTSASATVTSSKLNVAAKHKVLTVQTTAPSSITCLTPDAQSRLIPVKRNYPGVLITGGEGGIVKVLPFPKKTSPSPLLGSSGDNLSRTDLSICTPKDNPGNSERKANWSNVIEIEENNPACIDLTGSTVSLLNSD